MNIKIFIWLLVTTCLANSGKAKNDRYERSVQYFIEGLIGALTQKHAKNPTPAPTVLPFAGFTKLNGQSKERPPLRLTSPLPSQIPIPEARISAEMPLQVSSTNKPTVESSNGPSKFNLPLMDISAPPSTSSSTTTPRSTTISTTSTTSTTTPASMTTTTTQKPTTQLAQIMIEMIKELTTTTTESPALISVPTSSTIENLVEPVSPEPRANLKTARVDEERSSIFPLQQTRVLSGRHTQLWGHPVFLQSQNALQPIPQLPLPQIVPINAFYADYDYNNIDGEHPDHHANRYHGSRYLPPIAGNQLFVLPFPLPIHNPALLYRNPDNSHSRVKLHNSDYNQYVYHGTDPSQTQVPIQHPIHHQSPNAHSHGDPRSQTQLVRQTNVGPYFNLEPHGQVPVPAQSQVVPQIQLFNQRSAAPRAATPRSASSRSRSVQSSRAVTQASHLLPQTHVQYFGQKSG